MIIRQAWRRWAPQGKPRSSPDSQLFWNCTRVTSRTTSARGDTAPARIRDSAVQVGRRRRAPGRCGTWRAAAWPEARGAGRRRLPPRPAVPAGPAGGCQGATRPWPPPPPHRRLPRSSLRGRRRPRPRRGARWPPPRRPGLPGPWPGSRAAPPPGRPCRRPRRRCHRPSRRRRPACSSGAWPRAWRRPGSWRAGWRAGRARSGRGAAGGGGGRGRRGG